jgi:GNAT superfamily N-acetyltransferase
MAANLELVTDSRQIDVAHVITVFSQAGWTKQRDTAAIQRMLAHTDVAILARLDGRPVGFARAITDRTFRAFIEDVIVVEDLRGAGVGKQMLARLEELISELGIARVELTTTQVGFWHKLGYAEKPSTTYMVKYLSS